MKLIYDKLIQRRKKVYVLNESEVLNGDWLNLIRSEQHNDENIEFEYKNGYLNVVFYSLKTRGGRDENAEMDERIGRWKSRS